MFRFKIGSMFSVITQRSQCDFKKSQTKFIVLGIIFFALFILSYLPYFNLFLSKTLVFFLVYLLAVFWLKLPGRVSIIFALLLLGICPFLLIFKLEHLAEEVANLVFGLLVVGVTQEFWKEICPAKRDEIQ